MIAKLFSGIELIWDRQFGFLKETLVAPVSRFEIILGRILGGATVSIFQGVLVLIISLAVGFKISNVALIPLAFLFMFLISLFFTSLGTAIAARMEDMQAFPLIINFIMMPMFFLSGAIFPLKGLPKSIALVAGFDPLSYGVDGLRFALTGETHFGLFMDFSVLIVLSLLFIGLASYMFSKIEV